MIYRLVLREGYTDDNSTKGKVAHFFNEQMTALGLNPPKKKNINPRARFYFTKWGWNKVGRKLAKMAEARGFWVRVEQRKNPKRSQVVYFDSYQVALLPK